RGRGSPKANHPSRRGHPPTRTKAFVVRPLEGHLMRPEQSTAHIASANLARWLGPEIPERVVEAAREDLRAKDIGKRLPAAWVMAFGDDLHMHLTTFGGDFRGEDPAAYAVRVAKGAALAALAQGFEMGLGAPAKDRSPLALAGRAQEEALDLRRLDFPFTER